MWHLHREELEWNSSFDVRVWTKLWNAIVVSAVFNCCSHEPFKWSEASREADPYNIVQASDGAASPRGTGGQRSDQGLWKFSSTSFQETRLQKFPKHLSPFCYSSSVQYSVSVCMESSYMAEYKNVCKFSARVNPVSSLLLAGGQPAHLPVVPHCLSSPRSYW